MSRVKVECFYECVLVPFVHMNALEDTDVQLLTCVCAV